MTSKTTLQIALLLPNAPDLRDRCVQRLNDAIKSKQGIDAAHVVEATEGSGEICIHFDPSKIDLGEVRRIAEHAGAELSKRYGHLLLTTETMHVSRARHLEERFLRTTGVLEAAVSPAGVIRIEFDRQKLNDEQLRFAVSQLLEQQTIFPGKRGSSRAEGEEKHEHGHSHDGVFGEQGELICAAICGGLLLTGWGLSFITGVPTWLPWGFYLAAYLFGGFFPAREAVDNLRSGRFEIDSLMLAAAAGAAALGEWAEGALLLFLFSLGHGLEHYAMGRARRAIEALSKLAPETAFLRRDGEVVQVAVANLQIGDVTIIKPNERIPADGFVVAGESSINQAPITGESVPVEKSPVSDTSAAAKNPDALDSRHRAFAGTINERGLLEIQVTKAESDSALARIVRMVSDAETQKSAAQRFTDRFECYFVPAVSAGVVLLLFAGAVIDEPFSATFYRAMAVLVAASPCALAISTPSAVLSGIARGAQSGVLIKGGAALEALGALQAIAFDKTGTITEGKPKLTDVVPSKIATAETLLQTALAVERFSDHPLAAAVTAGATERQKGAAELEARDIRSITGRGVQAVISGEAIHIGSGKLFAEIDGPPLPDELRSEGERLSAAGRTTMYVRRGEKYLGVLGLMDAPRSSAKSVIAKLRRLGIRELVMLSGDNQKVANAVAKDVGIDSVRGELMPDDKVQAIQTLRESQPVAMVGDGVNDAPAMANASVGIAMGAMGSEVALETADIALMEDDLGKLPFAVGLGRQTRAVIRQNVAVSLGAVAVLIPATLYGLGIGPAVIVHEGATLVVVLNALRLLAFKDAAE